VVKPPGNLHQFLAASATERGFPPIEFRFRVADGLVVTELAAPTEGGVRSAVISAAERGPSDRLVGTIELGLFGASLIIDRAGVLHEVARQTAELSLAPPARARLLGEGEVELGGGTCGYRIDALLQLDEEGRFRPECPYASWLALAGRDPVVRGGVFAVVRSAGPDWRAAAALLDSLEIAGSGAAQPASEGGGGQAPRLHMPLVRHR
jgi:hypothetical protein